MNSPAALPDLEAILRQRFALERFRPGQREVIEQVLARRDVLCVMPTGGGKSLCYQLPGVVLPGVTLVVSPLIALMKDQVDVLTARGVRATFINSTLDPEIVNQRIAEAEAHRFELVYVAPERFRSPRFVEAMARARPALLAIDEAHCISEWGHDFRPDYARLGQARKALGMPPCIALTATATDLVRRDIADQLDLHDPALFVTGFDRPNLVYSVVPARRDADKLEALRIALERMPGPAIVYANSRKRCEEVGRFVETDLRRNVVVYHAGLDREQRTGAQDRFMSGAAEIVVATNAFGMGVDKADIRSVIHFNMPGTLEAYYQEAGRAGRDGRPAQCVLLYSVSDRFLQELFIENEYPPPEAVFQIYDTLRRIDADPIELTHAEIGELAGVKLNESAVGTALKLLEGGGVLERFRPRENMAIVRLNIEPGDPSLAGRVSPQAHVQRVVMTALEGLVGSRLGEPVYFHPDEFAAAIGLDRAALVRALKHLTAELPVDYVPPFRGNAIRMIDRDRKSGQLGIDFPALQRRKRQEYEKLERMVRYGGTVLCRRSYILGYFGDKQGAKRRCGRCDRCGSLEGPVGTGTAIDTTAGREVLLKILSGVARAKGRFGTVAIAQMLVGSASERMTRLGLAALSTFGILKSEGFSRNEIVQIIEALQAAGYVTSNAVGDLRSRPVLNLTELGWQYLRNKEPVPTPPVLALPADLVERIRRGGLERVVSSKPAAISETQTPRAEGGHTPDSLASDPLFETLRTLRLQWAFEANVPAYCVFRNQTLAAIVTDRPRTPAELARIKGMSAAKLERYGEAILEAVRIAAKPRSGRGDGEPRPVPGTPPSAPSHPELVPTEEWTRRLLERGFTRDEIAAIRGLDRAAVTQHLMLAARGGQSVPLDRVLDPDVIRRWTAWYREHGAEPPPRELGGTARDWELFLACLRDRTMV